MFSNVQPSALACRRSFREIINLKLQEVLVLKRMAKRQKMSALQLEDLPDEMIVKVFSYLKIGDLIHCGHVSKRIRQIWNVESLWQSIDFNDLDNGRGSKVQTDFIIFLLDKGCKYLNLRSVELTGSLKLDELSKLKRLNLEECNAKREVFEEILYSCHSLEQLSIIKSN